MSLIKESKELNKLLNEIVDIVYDEDMDYDIPSELKVAAFARENYDKCRSCDFDYHIQDGIKLAHLSALHTKPIYSLYSQRADLILYFVEDLKILREKLSSALDDVKSRAFEHIDNDILDLENQIKELQKCKVRDKKPVKKVAKRKIK